MLALACFEESGSWWFLAGFSDNVSHILDGVNAWSLAGFGWESFAWVRCTGFTDGVLPMGSIPGAAHW
jgi:hypothetical protein